MNDLKTPSLTHNNGPRTPSPNYFGLAVNANSNVNADIFASSAAQHLGGNWSPPSSNVRSTAAASPRVIPADQNPEFDQFRRQSENSRGFALGNFDFGSSQASIPTPKGSVYGFSKAPASPHSMKLPEKANEQSTDNKDERVPGPEKPRSPKRLLSTDSTIVYDRPRRNSPASFLDQENYGRTDEIAEFAENRSSRQSMPPKQSMHSLTLGHNRAETLPLAGADDNSREGPCMITPQHAINILESSVEEVLLLDLRVSTQYAKARIAGALSLCIPTTLLKRASFNVQKLAETFKEEDQRQKFESWRNSKHIIVYDANSSQFHDATTCVNTLKKFTTEGWTGGLYIIRGGFQEFADKFPDRVTQGSMHSSGSKVSTLRLDGLPSVAPVIGGCPMPATQNAANPFFGNIRQNMDLIGGVGQMPIKQPTSMTQSLQEELPEWLQKTTDETNKGKLVSDKFLSIEKQEQKRMQEALSGKVIYGTPSTGPIAAKSVSIAGIEKGSKNRYNSIWPYEHTRVKLQGVNDGGCDYINANHIQAPYSNKRYIATQGPLPATFNVSYVYYLPCPALLTEVGLLECRVATRCSRNCHAYCRARGRPAQSP